jgi:hypothetical protein
VRCNRLAGIGFAAEPLRKARRDRLPVVRATERAGRRVARHDDSVAAAPAAQVDPNPVIHALWIADVASSRLGVPRDSLREFRSRSRASPTYDDGVSSHASSMTQVTTHQVVAWIAAGGGAWMMVRAFAAKGIVKMRAPSHCAACGRKRVHGRCRCTDE